MHFLYIPYMLTIYKTLLNHQIHKNLYVYICLVIHVLNTLNTFCIVIKANIFKKI